jgi:hypothetical protein
LIGSQYPLWGTAPDIDISGPSPGTSQFLVVRDWRESRKNEERATAAEIAWEQYPREEDLDTDFNFIL